MKQHEYIYVPVEVGESVPANAKTIGLTRYKPVANSIVLTIEELRECFNWGMSTLEDMKTPYMSFEDFLRHKGIQL